MKTPNSRTKGLLDIKKAREEVRARKLVSQEKLFRALGLDFLKKEPDTYSVSDLKKRYMH